MEGLLNLGGGTSSTNQEYFLQSSVINSQQEVLLTRLRGICEQSTPLSERETVFSNQGVSLRIRQAVNRPEVPVTLRYMGAAEMDKPVMRRTCLEVAAAGNLPQLLKELGFTQEFDLRYEGHAFLQGRIRVTVCTVEESTRTDDSGQSIDWKRLAPKSAFVELSSLSSPIDETVSAEIVALAEHLKPLLLMTKIDHAKFNK